jgi:hypothetical protein
VEVQHAFALAEQLRRPVLFYPLAYDLGQWYDRAGRQREAAVLYGKAKAAITRMVASIEGQTLQSVFLRAALVQAISACVADAGGKAGA